MIELAKHINRQRSWSTKTFGPGERTAGIIAHIEKELEEIKQDPGDIFEWVDVIILAIDGAWRVGWTPMQIADAIREKQMTNELRSWPDWRTGQEGEAIEHIREEDTDARN